MARMSGADLGDNHLFQILADIHQQPGESNRQLADRMHFERNYNALMKSGEIRKERDQGKTITAAKSRTIGYGNQLLIDINRKDKRDPSIPGETP